GSMEYSAVTQPCPVPRRWGGTRSSTVAVIHTRVRPISIRQEPSAWTLTPSSILTGRRSSGSRPSWRGTAALMPRDPQQQRGPFIEDVEGHAQNQRRQRIAARQQEVGEPAQGDNPGRPAAQQPARAAGPQQRQR